MELTKEEKVVVACQEVFNFSQIVCEQVITDEAPDFHKEIYNLLTTEERIVMAAPRGFAKSTIVSKIYPLWLALFKKKKDICIISASEGLATEHLRYIKQELETNPLINGIWGNLKSDKWTETHIVVRHQDGTRINIRAKGAGGQIRGFRPDCVILDDIETDESVESEEQRKKLKNWLFKACLNTLLPGGQLILIGTVIHPLSVLADLLDTPNGWIKKRYTAYVDGIEEKGHELWPEARPHAWLQDRKREIGSFRFAAEFMNDPKSDESAPIKEEYIRYWEDLPSQLSLAIAIDPAYSEDEKADYKVAVLIGIDPKNNRYLVDYIRTHVPTGQFIDQVFNLYQRHERQVTAFGVPHGGTEKEFFNTVTNKALERRLAVPITPLKNTFVSQAGGSVRKKKNRIIAALQPWFEKGQYYIHANHFEAREELLTIGSSRWDDVVDAMSYAEQIITPQFVDVTTQNYEQPRMMGRSSSYGIDY